MTPPLGSLPHSIRSIPGTFHCLETCRCSSVSSTHEKKESRIFTHGLYLWGFSTVVLTFLSLLSQILSWALVGWMCHPHIPSFSRAGVCCGLYMKCLPKAQAFEHLVPNWWLCLGNLWNLEKLEKIGYWGQDLRVYELFSLPVLSLFPDFRYKVSNPPSYSCIHTFSAMMDLIPLHWKPE